jgi:hypothetical protein
MIQFLIKALSGRYVLTVVCAFVFAYCAVRGRIPVDATVSILTMVFVSYFNRNRDEQQTGGQTK